MPRQSGSQKPDDVPLPPFRQVSVHSSADNETQTKAQVSFGHSPLHWLRVMCARDRFFVTVIAIVIGLCGGGLVIVFHEGIDALQTLLYGAPEDHFHITVPTLPWYQIVLMPMLGGLMVGLYYRFLMPGRTPLGIPQAHRAARTGFFAAIGSTLSLGSGASVGREGPAVHLGVSIAAFFADILGTSRGLTRTFMGCGAAAAVAASFNAPIAGALFAHEVVVGHYALSAFAPVVISSVAATALSRNWHGDSPAFGVPDFVFGSWWELPAFMALGVLSGVVAVVMMRGVFFGGVLAEKTRLPVYMRPMVAGGLLGCVALVFPEALGLGYSLTTNTLHDMVPWPQLLMLLGIKIVVTCLCLSFGFGGGVFSPSVTIGALLGGVFGVVVTALFPDISSGAAAYALIGMGAVAASVLGAPISTTLIIFEMTTNYNLTLGLMAAIAIATLVSSYLYGHASFFDWQLARMGISVRGGHDLGVLRSLKVRDFFRADCTRLLATASVHDAREALFGLHYPEIFVVNEQDQLLGIVGWADIPKDATDNETERLITTVMRTPAVLQIDDSFEEAIQLAHDWQEEHIPVCAGQDGATLIGWVSQADVLRAYNAALVGQRAEEKR
jgi:CIC family chloride channel protein